MRRPVVFIAFFLLIISAFAIAQAVYSRDLYARINGIWRSYSEIPARKSALFGELTTEIGYTGFVHNFKNYVLRGDPVYRDSALQNFRRASELIKAYLLMPLNEREHDALVVIQDVLENYVNQLKTAERLIGQGLPPAAIDRQARVSDSAAAVALVFLGEEIRSDNLQGQETLAQKIDSAEDVSSIQVIIILLSVLAAIAATYKLFRLATDRRRLETNLAHSEQRFALAFENDAVANVIIDENGIIQFLNSATLKMFGYTKEELVGQNVSTLMPEAFARNHQEYLKRYLETGVAKIIGISRELSAKRKSGEEFPIHLGIGEFPSGDSRCFIGSIQELTDLKASEANLENALSAADRANSIKSQFLANMSHELRTPLNAIVGFSEMMTLGILGEKSMQPYKEYADYINGSAKHLLELVNEILDLSQIEAGKRELDLKTVSGSALIDETLMLTQQLAVERNIDVEIVVSPEDLMIVVDQRAMRQILVNLLSNAIKYSLTEGFVSVQASIDGDRIKFEISDDGVGIPAFKLDKITSRFTRAVDDPYTSSEGWGLGLSITKSLVEMHGGTMSIKSTVGEGTSVEVHLPIFSDNEFNNETLNPQERDQTPSMPHLC